MAADRDVQGGTRLEAAARLMFWLLLVLSWVVAVAYMWDAMVLLAVLALAILLAYRLVRRVVPVSP